MNERTNKRKNERTKEWMTEWMSRRTRTTSLPKAPKAPFTRTKSRRPEPITLSVSRTRTGSRTHRGEDWTKLIQYGPTLKINPFQPRKIIYVHSSLPSLPFTPTFQSRNTWSTAGYKPFCFSLSLSLRSCLKMWVLYTCMPMKEI